MSTTKSTHSSPAPAPRNSGRTYVFPPPDKLVSDPEEERQGKMSAPGHPLPSASPPVRQRKPPLLKTSSLGLGTSTFGTTAPEHNNPPANPTSSLSNLRNPNPGPGPSSAAFNNPPPPTRKPIRSALKGHTRSASHGGVIIQTPSSGMGESAVPTKASVLRKGHTRAASHGQIVEDQPPLKGHSRVPSKTDFILPPGHKERERLSSGTAHSIKELTHWRGHSRQASRSESIYTLRQHKVPLKNRILFWRRTETQNPKMRVVVPNHTVPDDIPENLHPNGSYPNNRVRTTKYTLLSFLPKNLFEQFHRFANLYFISIVLLNFIPEINAFGKEIALLPVMFVLGVTAIKDLFEDRRRYNSDKRVNNSSCRVWNR